MFLVGEWEIEPSLNRARRGEESVRLEPKVMQVLQCLIEAGGAVVSRETLIARGWPDVHVSDDVLHRAIGELRRMFGDSATSPRYIETIRKRGYRLVAPVAAGRPSADVVPPVPPSAGFESGVSANAPRAVTAYTALFARTLAAVLVVACAAAVVLLLSRGGDVPTNASARFVPVVSGPLNEADPALSPDGRRLAYVERDFATGRASLVVRDLVDGQTMRVSDADSIDRAPAWSPDGRRLAFARLTPASCDLFVSMLDGSLPSRAAGCGNHDEPQVAWTLDGRALLLSQASGDHAMQGWRLARLDLSSGALAPVTRPPAHTLGDHTPAVSPDGRSVAFIRRVSAGIADIFVAALDGSGERRITAEQADITGVDWTQDGRTLIYSSDRAGGYALFRVPVAGGPSELIAGGAARLKHPVVSRASDRVIYENWLYEINVWRVSLTGSDDDAETDAAPVIRTSELWNLQPQVSPDGTRLAYVSTQSGDHELWIADRDGRHARQLTRQGWVKMPRWSPDGSRIAYLARADRQVDAFAIEVAGGDTIRLTRTPAAEAAPAWSHDGRAVFVGAADGDGAWRVSRIEAAAPTRAQVVVDGGVAAQASPDGRWIYYSRADRAGLWRQPLDGGGAPALVIDSLPPGSAGSWLVTPHGLFVIASAASGIELRRVELDGGRMTRVAALPDIAWPGFSLSPDGAHVYYARADRRESNLMALEY